MNNTNKNTNNVRFVSVEVANEADKIIMEKALKLLDKAGYTICKKTSLVLENDLKG